MGGHSLPFQSRGSFTVTLDASGNALYAVVPGFGVYGYKNATGAAGVWTLGAAWDALGPAPFLTTNAFEARVVSAGLIFRSTASMTNCQGILHAYVVPSLAPGGTLRAMNQNNAEDQLYPLTSGFELSMLSKPTGTSSHAFIPMTSITNTMSNFDWSIMIIEVSGGIAATNIGFVEVVHNIEFSLNATAVSTTGLGGVVSAPRPANPVAIAAQNAIHSSVPSIIQGGIDQVERRITSAAGSAVESLLSSAMSYGTKLLTLL